MSYAAAHTATAAPDASDGADAEHEGGRRSKPERQGPALWIHHVAFLLDASLLRARDETSNAKPQRAAVGAAEHMMEDDQM